MSSAPQTAICAVHVTTQAPFICDRCGRYCCNSCAEMIMHESVHQTFCTECHAKVTLKASPQAVTALVLGILGLQCFMPFLGIPAVIIGYQQLAAHARGEVSAKSRSVAIGAIVLGWIGVAVMVIAIIAGVLFLVNVSKEPF